MAVVLSVVALVVALAALAVVLLGRRTDQQRRTPADQPVPPDVETLRAEVEALRAESSVAFSRLALVRYDAFGDMGGQLSWSLALTDERGDGVLVSSIHGRNDSRTYAKNVTAWSCEQQLSPQEAEAVEAAKVGQADTA